MASPLVITAASALTAYGVGPAAYVQGFEAGPAPFAPMTGSYAQDIFCARVPSYDARQLLAVRSISNFDRLTLHVCVAVDALHKRLGFGDTRERRARLPDDRISLVLGSSGPLQSIVDLDLQTIEEPSYVQPSIVPNLVFNVPASYAAIRHGIRGSCITLTDGDTSSLKALAMAATQLESGRIDLALVGGAEEATPAYALYRAALAAAGGQSCPRFAEGAAMFALERAEDAAAAGRASIAKLFGCVQVFAPHDPHAGLAACIDKLRRRFGGVLDDVGVVYAAQDTDLGRVGLDRCRSINLADRLGHFGAMSASMAMLDALVRSHVAPGELILIVQGDREGACAAGLLQKHATLH
jgi:3-oxoacyl-[acyl-carrier-protein] synthase II